MNFRDCPARVEFFKRDRGFGAKTLRREVQRAEVGRKSHGKTAGVGCGNQLLGVGALSVFKARGEGIRSVCENPARGRYRSLSVFQRAFPDGCPCSLHGMEPPWGSGFYGIRSILP